MRDVGAMLREKKPGSFERAGFLTWCCEPESNPLDLIRWAHAACLPIVQSQLLGCQFAPP